MQQYPAMECIQEYVDVSYHRLISKGMPHLSRLMQNQQSDKLLNGTVVSNENNVSESSLVKQNIQFKLFICYN